MIHLYGIGFGPVEPAQTTGKPAPASPPAQATSQFTCYVTSPDRQQRYEVPILFAGLAPGVLGYYQISVQMPQHFLSSPRLLICNGPNGTEPYFQF